MNILVTGSSGFFGEHLCRRLSQRSEHSLYTLDRTSSFQNGAICQNFFWRDRAVSAQGVREVLDASPFDLIIHSAAMSSFGQCEELPEEAELANVEYTRGLAQLAKEQGAYLAFISTDLVFDGNEPPAAGGFTEGDSPLPRSVYAQTKYRAEEILRELLPESSVILRSSLLYGPPAGRGGGPLRWLLSALEEGQEVTLFPDEWRTPLLVTDLVRVVEQCLVKRPVGLLHCAGLDRMSRVEFGRAVASACKKELLLREISRTTASGPARPEDVSLSNQRVQQELGINLTGITGGLESLFADRSVATLE